MAGDSVIAEFVIPETIRVDLLSELDQQGSTTISSGELYEPGDDEPGLTTDSDFDPLLLVVASVTIPFMIGRLQRIWRDARQPGGYLIDVRGGKVRVRELKKLDRGVVVHIDEDGKLVIVSPKDERELIGTVLGALNPGGAGLPAGSGDQE